MGDERCSKQTFLSPGPHSKVGLGLGRYWGLGVRQSQKAPRISPYSFPSNCGSQSHHFTWSEKQGIKKKCCFPIKFLNILLQKKKRVKKRQELVRADLKVLPRDYKITLIFTTNVMNTNRKPGVQAVCCLLRRSRPSGSSRNLPATVASRKHEATWTNFWVSPRQLWDSWLQQINGKSISLRIIFKRRNW